MPTPQVPQTPLTAGRPFFMVTFLALVIVFLALHFTQYAISAIVLPLLAEGCTLPALKRTYIAPLKTDDLWEPLPCCRTLPQYT